MAFLGEGGVGNTPLILKAANSPTWLPSETLGHPTNFINETKEMEK